MGTAAMQAKINKVFGEQESNHFGASRYAYLFKPGTYQLNVQLGFYMTAAGLGKSPDDVTITGNVGANASWFKGNATQNFWRGIENLSVVSQQNGGTMMWAVAQATAMRRVHVKNGLNLWDFNYPSPNWSSGGFIADTKVDAAISSGSQQQFLVRNSAMSEWRGGVWNMVFVGDVQAPAEVWPSPPYTVVPKTPRVREKPYLTFDAATSSYAVVVPRMRTDSQGITWGGGAGASAATTIDIKNFYVAHADKDTAETMSIALQRGKHLLLTPGIYHLTRPIEVTRAGTVVLGLGMATLLPDKGTAALTVDDVDGVTIAGVILDAGTTHSPTMLELGSSKSKIDHSVNPTALFDVSCRVGGASAGSTGTCVVVNINDAILDNVWLWRADHGSGVGWNTNPSINGLVVNGANVTAYGLFVEHFEGYQTVWQGEGGRVFFYQSEIPYDVPNQAVWNNNGQKGFASYKVADSVKTHEAQGMGVYCVFLNAAQLDNAIEFPTAAGVKMRHMTTQWLGVEKSSSINHIYNGTGIAVNAKNMSAFSAD